MPGNNKGQGRNTPYVGKGQYGLGTPGTYERRNHPRRTTSQPDCANKAGERHDAPVDKADRRRQAR